MGRGQQFHLTAESIATIVEDQARSGFGPDRTSAADQRRAGRGRNAAGSRGAVAASQL